MSKLSTAILFTALVVISGATGSSAQYISKQEHLKQQPSYDASDAENNDQDSLEQITVDDSIKQITVDIDKEIYQTGSEIMIDIGSGVIQGGNNEHEKDIILVELKNCIEKHGFTLGMHECLVDAYDSYDEVMNQVYKQALAANDDATKKSLMASQRKWLAFRNAEEKAQHSYAATPRGSVIGIVMDYQKLTAIRERISELMFYLGADQG